MEEGAGSQRRWKEGASALQALGRKGLRRSSQVKVKTTNACRGIALFSVIALAHREPSTSSAQLVESAQSALGIFALQQ